MKPQSELVKNNIQVLGSSFLKKKKKKIAVLNYNQNQTDDSNIEALYIDRYIDIDVPEKSKLSL